MKIGFRIEFFCNLQPDQSAAGLVVSASNDDAFEVDVVPAIHERVAGLSLLGRHGHLLEAHDSPFLRVPRVELRLPAVREVVEGSPEAHVPPAASSGTVMA